MAGPNPIQSVDGVEPLIPSKFQWSLQDVSAPDAGRTEDTTMDKMRIGQAVKIALAWPPMHIDKLKTVLRAFNPQYITVTYLDPLEGGFRTSEFYVGDRAVPLYNTETMMWESVAFNIIERKAVER